MRALLAAALLLPAPLPLTGLGCKDGEQAHVFETRGACVTGCPCHSSCSFWPNPRKGDGPGETDLWYCRCPCSAPNRASAN